MPKKSNKRRMTARMKTKTNTKTRMKTRNQKPVLMIGCSVPKVNTKNYLSLGNKSLKHRYKYKKLLGGLGCGSSGCPISPLSTEKMLQLGGTCNTCSQLQLGGTCNTCSQLQLGGNAPFVPPFVPGVNGVSRNYLSPYNTNNDPQLQMSMNNAGYNTKNSLVGGKKNKKFGGGLMPQDLVNLGRDYTYNFKSTYNALNGYKAPVDPSPYKGQLTGSLIHNGFFS